MTMQARQQVWALGKMGGPPWKKGPVNVVEGQVNGCQNTPRIASHLTGDIMYRLFTSTSDASHPASQGGSGQHRPFSDADVVLEIFK